MPVWDIVKDLNVEINDETSTKILKKMTAEDWALVKAELEQATKDNQKLTKTIELINKVIDLVLTKGIDLIL